MGPLELTDMIGQDVNFAVTRSVFNAFWQERRFFAVAGSRSWCWRGVCRKAGRAFTAGWRTNPPSAGSPGQRQLQPMRGQRSKVTVSRTDDLLLIETQGETAQSLALRHGCWWWWSNASSGCTLIAAAPGNPHAATQKAIYWLQHRGETVVQIADYPGLLRCC